MQGSSMLEILEEELQGDARKEEFQPVAETPEKKLIKKKRTKIAQVTLDSLLIWNV
ncbi:hypothetical protein SESBI_41634 [Sesbania bispinosa]|nr:hypothetical protein SESBI_41634 [Sesbania bispinosa]